MSTKQPCIVRIACAKAFNGPKTWHKHKPSVVWTCCCHCSPLAPHSRTDMFCHLCRKGLVLCYEACIKTFYRVHHHSFLFSTTPSDLLETPGPNFETFQNLLLALLGCKMYLLQCMWNTTRVWGKTCKGEREVVPSPFPLLSIPSIQISEWQFV